MVVFVIGQRVARIATISSCNLSVAYDSSDSSMAACPYPWQNSTPKEYGHVLNVQSYVGKGKEGVSHKETIWYEGQFREQLKSHEIIIHTRRIDHVGCRAGTTTTASPSTFTTSSSSLKFISESRGNDGHQKREICLHLFRESVQGFVCEKCVKVKNTRGDCSNARIGRDYITFW